MPSDERPSFIVLETALPTDRCREMILGRVVADTRNPADIYEPEEPANYLTTYFLEITDKDFLTFARENKRRSVKAVLGKFLGLDVTDFDSAVDDHKGDIVRTRRLVRHDKVKEALISKHKDEVRALLRKNDDLGYLTVGFKTVIGGNRSMEFEKGKKVTLKGQAPVAEAASALGGASPNLPVNPEVDVEAEDDAYGKYSKASVDEQIFAVQYRPLTLKRSLFSGQETIGLGQLKRLRFGAAVYGTGESDDETFEDDDDFPGDEVIMADEPISESHVDDTFHLVF